jgi:hypothetical protein
MHKPEEKRIEFGLEALPPIHKCIPCDDKFRPWQSMICIRNGIAVATDSHLLAHFKLSQIMPNEAVDILEGRLIHRNFWIRLYGAVQKAGRKKNKAERALMVWVDPESGIGFIDEDGISNSYYPPMDVVTGNPSRSVLNDGRPFVYTYPNWIPAWNSAVSDFKAAGEREIIALSSPKMTRLMSCIDPGSTGQVKVGFSSPNRPVLVGGYYKETEIQVFGLLCTILRESGSGDVFNQI